MNGSRAFEGSISGLEVDFMARGPEGKEELIQVCADASDADTASRELKALEDAGRAHPRATRTLLVAAQGRFPPEVPKGITVRTAYDWMLEDGLGSHPP